MLNEDDLLIGFVRTFNIKLATPRLVIWRYFVVEYFILNTFILGHVWQKQ